MSAPRAATVQQPAVEEPAFSSQPATKKQTKTTAEEREDENLINIDAAASAVAPQQPKTVADPTGDPAIPYRPRLRPPMAIVRVLDDDGSDGEAIRIREKEIVIGRSEGDVVIAHERLMSGKHAMLARRYEEGQYRWYLKDLDSTNGSFVKVKGGRLNHNVEIMIGAFRYRFDAAPQGAPESEEPASDSPPQTLGWKKVSPDDLTHQLPYLVRITPEGETDQFVLRGDKQIIGASPNSANVVINDDPMVSAAHVEIYQDKHNRWFMKDVGSLNGTWLAVKELRIETNSMFQLGEQRFSLKLS